MVTRTRHRTPHRPQRHRVLTTARPPQMVSKMINFASVPRYATVSMALRRLLQPEAGQRLEPVGGELGAAGPGVPSSPFCRVVCRRKSGAGTPRRLVSGRALGSGRGCDHPAREELRGSSGRRGVWNRMNRSDGVWRRVLPPVRTNRRARGRGAGVERVLPAVAVALAVALVPGGAAWGDAPPPEFAPKADYPTGTLPYSVAMGDFNGDGKPDLAIANYGDNSVSVLLGVGDGTFGPKTDFPTDVAPQSVAVGDFNADGKLDLVTANSFGHNVSVLLGVGDGTFGAKTDFSTGATPRSVAVGDFNADGKPDLATANQDGSSVSVLLGVGDGTFGPKTDYPVGSDPLQMAVGDLNEDGNLDLAVVNGSDHDLSVLAGNGDGTFGTKTDFPTGTNPGYVAVGDLDEDGKPDLAVANNSDNTVSVFLNQTELRTLTVTKSAVEADFRKAGDILDYTYTVTNTGTVALTDVKVEDPGTAGVGCGTNQLAVGESTTCKGTHTVTESDVTAKAVTNQATATGMDGEQSATATSDQVIVHLSALALTLTSADTEFTAPGQTIDYSYTVTNTGSTPLSKVTVTDDNPATTVTCPADTLDPGASLNCSASLTTTVADQQANDITTIAGTTATAPGGQINATSTPLTTPYTGPNLTWQPVTP
ncbi:FG-GAP-like repeat-containing protein [Streptomyces sp. NPDC054840]